MFCENKKERKEKERKVRKEEEKSSRDNPYAQQ